MPRKRKPVPSQEWYYVDVTGGQAGPITTVVLHELLTDGTLTPGMLAWTEGMEEWTPICDIAALKQPAESVERAAGAEGADGADKPKRVRKSTGIVRRWSVDEDELFRELMLTFDPSAPKKPQFEEFAERLNTWAVSTGIATAGNGAITSVRTAYGIEQHWNLYLVPGAPRAALASAAKVGFPPEGVTQATPSDGRKIQWEPNEDDGGQMGPVEADFPALAMGVAEAVSMQTMSRMCRKGMGFRHTDDPRLREAEHQIVQQDEIEKLAAALAPIAAAEPHDRPASLCAVQRALAGAWHRWRETDLTTAHARVDPSGCLGEPWHHEHEAPRCYGLAERVSSLWISTLLALPDATPPLRVVRELAEMDTFMRDVGQLDERRRMLFVAQATKAEAAQEAAERKVLADAAKARAKYFAECAAERKKAHKRHLAAFKAVPAKERKAAGATYAAPGVFDSADVVCWQCCAGSGAAQDRSVVLESGEETTPLTGAKGAEEAYLPEPGDQVAYCYDCYQVRCGALGIQPVTSDDEDDAW